MGRNTRGTNMVTAIEKFLSGKQLEGKPVRVADTRLRYSPANSKLAKMYDDPEIMEFLGNRKIYSLDLLSGHTCPFAKDCHSKVVKHRDGSKSIKDGKHTQFRCYSASLELARDTVYQLRKRNTDAITSCKGVDDEVAAEIAFNLMNNSLPSDAGIVRAHTGGGMKWRWYFMAWMKLARANPDMLFYAYLKALPYWVEFINEIPRNFVLTASRGGTADHLIDEYGLREAQVVFDEDKAAELGLEIDTDDSHACKPWRREQSFALLIHGVQPAGSDASKALSKLRKRGAK
tara:strand:- start:105 stop:971 length:867 start_codon:yes stop_codon:yes gene_type:complete